MKILGALAELFRNLTSRKMFQCLDKYCRGKVLDVGGGHFYSYVRKRSIMIDKWTSLDVDGSALGQAQDAKHAIIVGDGCCMTFPDGSFDTIVNCQVLEHVFEPLKMVSEISRVLSPGGYAIFLIPQTACIHLIPNCYGNFSIYWIREALKMFQLEIVEEHALGGFWRTICFRYMYFFLQVLGIPSFTSEEYKRSKVFYLLLPLMVVYILVSFPILAILQLGDLKEEPNNHLVVAMKPY
jgi:SAM-dependent methyltransferase